VIRSLLFAASVLFATAAVSHARADELFLASQHSLPADYRLPYGTYSGQYDNWRTYGVVGSRVAQYGPLTNKNVPRWKYNVKTGSPDGFDLKTR
jgi:hypothetical protein